MPSCMNNMSRLTNWLYRYRKIFMLLYELIYRCNETCHYNDVVSHYNGIIIVKLVIFITMSYISEHGVNSDRINSFRPSEAYICVSTTHQHCFR